MKVSNRVKRNLSGVLSLIGVFCVVSRACDLWFDVGRVRSWVNLFFIVMITLYWIAQFNKYRRLWCDGHIYGDGNDQ